MDTKRFEELVAAYVEGALDEELMRAMDAKRAECRQCNKLARIHESILTALSTTEPVKAPAGLGEKILAAVATEEAEATEARKIVRRALTVSIAVAASLLACIIPLLNGTLIKSTTAVSGAAAQAASGLTGIVQWWTDLTGSFSSAASYFELAKLYLQHSSPAGPVVIFIACCLISLSVMAWASWEYFRREQEAVLTVAV